ncbi:hypothetical protein BSKO_13120 [Bryopsis sp. KO-2023]|nr:hypothetical protein BSKO_13120 [Bryopsis sp. KO-2023]
MVFQSVCAFFGWIRHCFDLAFVNGVFRRSTIVSILVGTILTLINQGEILLQGQVPLWWKVLLTYLVPFLVSSYGSMSAILLNESKANNPNTKPLLASYNSRDAKSISEDVADVGVDCGTPKLTTAGKENNSSSIFHPANAEKV